MGRLTTTPGMWIVRGIGIWLALGLVGGVLGFVIDGRTPDEVADSPVAVAFGGAGLIVLVACLVAAAVSWNWDLRPSAPAEAPRAATEEERYGSLYAAADDLERRKAARRR